MYNNNHCHQITDEQIKKSVVYGNTTDLNRFNPATKFEFNTGEEYNFYMFNDIEEKINQRTLTKKLYL